MSDSVDRVFVHALNTVKRIPRTGSARPPEADRLKLYGLYKQSTEGDVAGLLPRPILPSQTVSTYSSEYKTALAEREKYDAWNINKGMGRTEAKRQYIATLIGTMHQYATTTSEARELVAELEFVWDQIKSQAGSASESSSPGAQDQTRTGVGQGTKHARSSDRDQDYAALRKLRPMSEDEDEEEQNLEEEDEDVYEDTRQAPINQQDQTVSARKDLDIRNKKWRHRMENALMNLSVEVAALREQIEARQTLGTAETANTGWAWTRWLLTLLIRHLFIDAAIMISILVWARRKSDRRLEQGLRLLYIWVQDQVRAIKIPWVLRSRLRKIS